MASPAIQISLIPSSSPLQRLSTFKDRTTTTTTTTPTSATGTITSPLSSILFSSSPLDSLSSNPIFSVFFSSDFDSATTLSFGSVVTHAEKLQDGIRLLEKQLCSEVLSRHDDLLSQLSSLRDVESVVSTLRSAVTTLQSSVCRVLSEIVDPNRQIKNQVLLMCL